MYRWWWWKVTKLVQLDLKHVLHYTVHLLHLICFPQNYKFITVIVRSFIWFFLFCFWFAMIQIKMVVNTDVILLIPQQQTLCKKVLVSVWKAQDVPAIITFHIPCSPQTSLFSLYNVKMCHIYFTDCTITLCT